MTKITLAGLTSLTNETSAILSLNTNFSVIQSAFENNLSRDGTAPNQMLSNFDMNSHRVLNLPNPISATEPLRLQDLSDFLSGGVIHAIPAGGAINQVLSKTSASDYAVAWASINQVGAVSAADYGVLPNGTDVSAQMQTAIAVAVARGVPLLVGEGTFKINHSCFLNTTAAAGVLTVPGLRVKGSGRKVTYFDTGVSGDYVFSTNPAWRAAHRSMYSLPLTGGGTLGNSAPIGTLGSITPGSAYTTGTYNGVALTGGAGTGATANVTVAGGAVTVVTLVNAGTGYAVGNTLSVAAASVGGTGSGFSIPVASATYYVQMTMNDAVGTEIFVTLPKSVSVTATAQRINITLEPLGAFIAPGYSYNLYIGTATQPANYGLVSGLDGVALGGGQTVAITALGSAKAVPSAVRAVWQEAQFEDFSIINSAGTANAGGVRLFKSGYSKLNRVTMENLTGDGLNIPGYTGDVDGSFVIQVTDCKFDTIAGWGINAAPAALEFSNFLVSDCVFNLCGTNANTTTTFPILSISNSATPTITTTGNHGLSLNDQVYIDNVTGMTLAAGWYRATGTITATTFSLSTLAGVVVDTTSLGAYSASSGRVRLAWRPPVWSSTTVNTVGSGGIAYLGLISTFRNLGFTQCKNVSLYISENGSSDNVTIQGVDFENTYGKGLYVGGAVGGSWTQGELLATAGVGDMIGGVQFGTGFNSGGVRNFIIANVKVRSNVTPAVAFELFPNTLQTGAFSDTIRIKNVDWSTYDAAGQTRFSGPLQFDAIPGQCQLTISALGTVKLAPTGFGNTMPLRAGGATSEWVPYQVPSGGLTLAGLTGLSASTRYYLYLSNTANSVSPIVGAIVAAGAAPILDAATGYQVSSGNAAILYLGNVVTDGSGNVATTSIVFSYYPAMLPPGQVSATTTNDAALAGNVGEYVESVIVTGSKVALVTATAKTITSISLTPGDWDVSVMGYILPAATTTTTVTLMSISGTTNTLDLTPGKFSAFTTASGTFTGGNEIALPIPTYRLSLSATTTVFMVAQSSFAVSTSAAYGLLRARRVR